VVIVLGIDTSGYTNAIGLVNGEEVLADESFNARNDSLEQIVANIDSILKSTGLALKDIGGIGVGLGPGSWTGIRVGVTVGKMLAFSLGKPVCGVSTLESLAYRAWNERSRICAVIGAGTGDNVYAAFYLPSHNGVTMDGGYFYGDIWELAVMITEPAVIIGTGIEAYSRIIGKNSGVLPAGCDFITAAPGGATVALLANWRLEKGESDDALSLTPLYLKESTARAFVNKYRRIGAEG
jgi:tRNA threonylcarbamoyladenosine biosynthesis protein TsaB